MTASTHFFETSRVADFFPVVHRRIHSAVDELEDTGALAPAVRRLVDTFPEEAAMIGVPLLVHGAQTGVRAPAVPVSCIHVLWWVAAHVFDDVIDEAPAAEGLDLAPGERLMAAVVCAGSLPFRIAAADLPRSVLPGFAEEFSAAWIGSNDGQIRDLAGITAHTTPQTVLTTYRQKNGAPYGMACAISARLAGADDEQVARWRDFGTVLGQLGQFRNDQEDLQDGRDEDLRNGTATYLLAHLLDGAQAADRTALQRDLGHAGQSPEACGRLRRTMLDARVLRGYLAEVDALRRRAHRCLDAVGTDGPDVAALRDLVEEAARPLPLFRQPVTREPLGAPT